MTIYTIGITNSFGFQLRQRDRNFSRNRNAMPFPAENRLNSRNQPITHDAEHSTDIDNDIDIDIMIFALPKVVSIVPGTQPLPAINTETVMIHWN